MLGRTGRAGRRGEAITLFTEADMPRIRSIANVVKLSGCEVPDWMLAIKPVRTCSPSAVYMYFVHCFLYFVWCMRAVNKICRNCIAVWLQLFISLNSEPNS